MLYIVCGSHGPFWRGFGVLMISIDVFCEIIVFLLFVGPLKSLLPSCFSIIASKSVLFLNCFFGIDLGIFGLQLGGPGCN